MGFTLDISVTRLRENDSIDIVLNSNTYTIDVINPLEQAATFQVRGTSDVIPADNEYLTAVSRLENVISQISLVTRISSSETVISITFENGTTFGGFTPSTTNGSLVVAVRTVGELGGVVNFNSPLVPNITVTSITHRLTEYNYTSLNYPHGNMSDKLETVISFTSASTFSVLDFYYGWTDNTTIAYPLASQNDYTINESLFSDLTTGAQQKYTGNTISINAVAPLQGNKVISIDLVNVSSNDYTLTFVHYVPILPRPIDRDLQNNLDKPAEIETSLKLLFKIDLKQDIIEPNPSESTSKQDLTPFISNGNIGYFGAVYNTGIVPYSLNNFVWNNTNNELNSGSTTPGTITLNKLTGNFDATHDVIVKIQKLTDVFNQSESQTQNYDFDSVQIKLNSTPASSTLLQNVEGLFTGSNATITFDVAPGVITSAYVVWVSVADGTTNKLNQNVQIKVSDAINAADDSTVIFGTYPSSPRSEYNYNFHYLDAVTDSFNQVKSYIDDFVISRFRIENTNTTINTFNSLTIRIRANQSVLETFTVTSDDFVSGVFAISRNYNLAANDVRDTITFVENGAGIIDVVYPFQILQTFVDGVDVVLETIVNYTQSTTVGNLEFTNNFISPVFELGQYDISKNISSDPQVTLPPSTITYFNEAGTEEVGTILSTGKTRVVATFEEDNLDDFLADPSAPHTYLDNVPTNNYLCAYFGLNTNNNASGDYYRFHNLRDNELSMWESVQSGYYAELVRVDVDTATLTAILDNEKIKETFGEDFECLKVTARLDKIQTAFVAPKAYKNNSYSSGYS